MPTKQFNVSLGDFLRTKLETASEQSGRTIAEEIRSRLARTFDQDTIDKPTLDLLAAVADFASLIQGQSGVAWHENAAADAALLAAIRTRLTRLRPTGAADVLPTAEGRTRFVPSEDPSEIGVGLEMLQARMAAGDDPKIIEQMEKDYRELTQLHKGKGGKP
jgi:hypothetical protein